MRPAPPHLPPPPAWRRVSLALLVLALLASCRSGAAGTRVAPGSERPARRTSGPREPAPFGGVPPAALGLVRVEGLLWMPEAEAARWGRGGAGVGAPSQAPPGEGVTLRTDHVDLRTDLSGAEALPLARAAEEEVSGLIAAYGEALDLRLPAAPVRITVFARRADFEVALAASVPEPTGWNAFYDVVAGSVRVCAEPAARAPLPVLADLRHELAHAVLDLSAPADPPHGAIVQGLHFWLWEGFAVFVESHPRGWAEPAEASEGIRRERFRARLAHGGPTRLAEFFRLDQTHFQGHHYDQAAVLMAFLTQDQGLRERTWALLRHLLRGDVLHNDVERDLGLSLPALEEAWSGWLVSQGLR